MKRNPLLHWLLVLLTFGQYAYVWTLLMASDVNRIAQMEKIKVRKHAYGFGLIWFFYCIGFIYIQAIFPKAREEPHYFHTVFFSVFALAIVLTIYFFWLLFKIASELKAMDFKRVPGKFKIFIFTCLYMISLPLLQRRINNAK
jgi:hypothetical protein